MEKKRQYKKSAGPQGKTQKYFENYGYVKSAGFLKSIQNLKNQLVYTEVQPKKKNQQAKFAYLLNEAFKENLQYFEPDNVIQSKYIESVIFSSNEEIICPICRSDSHQLIVPQITKCGHVFCFVCILKYMCYENSSRKCPLCSSYILLDELRLVQVRIHNQVQANYHIKLKLCRRLKDSYQLFDEDNGKIESRLKIVTQSQIKENYQKNISLIDNQIQVSQDNEDAIYLNQAKSIMKERYTQTIDLLNSSRNTSSKVDKVGITPNDYHYIYQEENGQNVYLHPSNFRYIIDQYQSGHKLPLYLESTVSVIHKMTFDEKTRERYRFLSHVPIDVELQLVEIELSQYLSQENSEKFKNEFEETQQRQLLKQAALDRINLKKYQNSLEQVDTTNQIKNSVNSEFIVNENEENGFKLDFIQLIASNKSKKKNKAKNNG